MRSIEPGARGGIEDETLLTPCRGTFLSWSDGGCDCPDRKLGAGITHAWVIPSGYPQYPWVITRIKLPISLT